MYRIIPSICLIAIVILLNYSRASADNCLPYAHFPPVIGEIDSSDETAILDVNFDGHADIVASPINAALLSDGTGALAYHDWLNTSLWIRQIHVGYLDSDAYPEVIAFAYGGEYDVFALLYSPDETGLYHLVDLAYIGYVGDVSGYGAILPTAPGSASVLVGQIVYVEPNGDGTSTVRQIAIDTHGFRSLSVTFTLNGASYDARITRLNSDRWADVIARDSDGNLNIYLSEGLTFPSEPFATIFPEDTIRDIDIEDLDGDGIPEILVVEEQTLRIYKREFDEYALWRVLGNDGRFQIVGFGDYDNDGDLDLFASEESCGTGSNDYCCLILIKCNGNFAYGFDQRLVSGCNTNGGAAVDLNDDGLNDIVSPSRSGITIHFADGLGGFLGTQPIATEIDEVEYPGTLTAIDLNHDSLDDLLVAQIPDGTIPLMNAGSGEFTPTAPIALNGLHATQAVDIDEDGFVDVVGLAGTFVVIGYGNAEGTLGPLQGLSANAPGSATDLAIGDINGDGHLDIAHTVFNSDRLTVHLGFGDRTYSDAYDFHTRDGPSGVDIADLNHDGLGDVVTGNYRDRSYTIYHGTDVDILAESLTQSAGFGPPVQSGIHLPDLDLDGNADLVTASSFGGIRIRWGTSSGPFGASTGLSASSYSDKIHIADINRDGFDDVVTYDSVARLVHVFINEGDRMFAAPDIIQTQTESNGIVIGNFDGVGDLDFATSTDNALFIHNSNTCGLLPLLPGDANGDGVLDYSDVPTFVSILVGNHGSLAARKATDMNADGRNDALDISVFVECLLNGGC